MSNQDYQILFFGLFLLTIPGVAFGFFFWKIPAKWSQFTLKDYLKVAMVFGFLALMHLSMFGMMYFGHRQ